MLKQTLLALLLVPMLFASCKKSDSPGNEFIINGIHDVNLGAVAGNVLPITVQQTSGTQEQVTISVTGLPAGITADIQPASGTPAFSSVITFNQAGTTPAGDYSIHVVATSASYSKTYDLKLTVPAFNGFTFDGKIYNKTNLTHVTNNFGGMYNSTINFYSNENGSAYFIAEFGQDWPKTDGTYTFHLGGSSLNSMYLTYASTGSTSSYWNNDESDTTQQATLIISGGKMKLTVSNAKMTSSSTSGTKTLTANISE